MADVAGTTEKKHGLNRAVPGQSARHGGRSGRRDSGVIDDENFPAIGLGTIAPLSLENLAIACLAVVGRTHLVRRQTIMLRQYRPARLCAPA